MRLEPSQFPDPVAATDHQDVVRVVDVENDEGAFGFLGLALQALVATGVGGFRFGAASPHNISVFLRRAKLPSSDKLDPQRRNDRDRRATSPPISVAEIAAILLKASRDALRKGATPEAQWLKSVYEWSNSTMLNLTARNHMDASFYTEQVLRPALVSLIREVRGERVPAPVPPAVIPHILMNMLYHAQRSSGVLAALGRSGREPRRRSRDRDRRSRSRGARFQNERFPRRQ